MKRKGLFIGLTTVDIQYFVDENPKPNSKIKTEAPLVSAGGPAANAALTYSFLGGNAHILTCIGENPFRDFLRNDFARHRVFVDDYLEGQVFQPTIATIFTNRNTSERTILTHHPDPLEHSGETNIDVGEYDFLLTDGFYPELSEPLCQQAKKRGIPVVLDGGSWKPPLAALLPWTDVAICSANFHPPGTDSVESVFSFLRDQGVGFAAISRGEEAIFSTGGSIPVPQVHAVDSLGAGDILHGAFCWFFSSGCAAFESLAKASKIAALSTCFTGTRQWMKHGEDLTGYLPDDADELFTELGWKPKKKIVS